MTPAARIAAAIDCLDQWLGGASAEAVLTTWGRSHRFAGSKDRAAIRDHVFDAVRRYRSLSVLGGARTGRGLMLGAVRVAGTDPDAVFSGEGHAPPPLSEDERRGLSAEVTLSETEALDVPDWVPGRLRPVLGPQTEPVLQALRHRAPVHLRVNTARVGRAEAILALSKFGIVARPHDLAQTALEVIEGSRRIRQSEPFQGGLVELQDAASQAVVEALGGVSGQAVIDLCAGGGGKALALAAKGAEVTATDAYPKRMQDLPERAKRAGARIRVVEDMRPEARYDSVFVDAPCSGSGAWRRQPEAKWRTSPDDLDRFAAVQGEILDRGARHLAPGGTLAYATCSLFPAENEDVAKAFLARHPDWTCGFLRRFSPLDGGDGFFTAHFQRA